MKVAVIDCGTNTFNLVIAEIFDQVRYNKLYNTRIPVKLGEAAINNGFIADAAFERGIEALRLFNDRVRKLNVEKILAFATSAIRDASNGTLFVKRVKDELDIDIMVIDGNREAELIYYGIRGAVTMKKEPSLIMDIGGGSNEFVIANKDGFSWKQSFKIGAARILDRFPHSNPIKSNEIETINAYLLDELKPLITAVQEKKPIELIGSSGAFDSIIEMIHGEYNGEPLRAEKTEYVVEENSYRKIVDRIMSSTLEERKQIKGLVPMRFDMIVISCIMIDLVLKIINTNKMRVSTYSLKEGALLEFMQQIK
ncbi:MAG: phosphatase [Bacteroidia bacterium]|nr:phosphatase [Bacteroidia bacterium]